MLCDIPKDPEGILREKLAGGVQPTSQNPHPIYNQNLRFLLPYLSPDQKFDSIFMTVTCDTVALNISYEELLLTVFFSDNDEKVVSSKKHIQFKTTVLKSYPI